MKLGKQLFRMLSNIKRRAFCRHDYGIIAMSRSTVTFCCRHCGKRHTLYAKTVPEDFLTWGYGWFHSGPTQETIELLKRQTIQPNNEIHIPERKVYIVSYFEKMEQRTGRDGRPGEISLGDILTKGLYFTQRKAEESLRGSLAACFCDDYPLAAIECFEEGLANNKGKIRFFRYDAAARTYLEFEAPAAVRNRIRRIATGVE